MQLKGVTDAVNNNEGFIGAGNTNEYLYDQGGNLTEKSSLSQEFFYNHLNLPRRITTPSGELQITYDATGNKLKEVNTISNKTRNYVAGMEYEGTLLSEIYFEDGRIQKLNGSWEYQYHITDHLGNIRVIFTDRNANAYPDQRNAYDYYPFGMKMNSSAGEELDNRYRYNGKEFVEEVGLLDYGARWYDPATARWNAVDPLADSYTFGSPYNYVLGNPLKYIDPDGMQVDDIINIEKSTGDVTITEAEGNDVVQLVDNGEVVDSYEYGENGSFQKETANTKISTQGTITTAVMFSEQGKADQFFEFAAQGDVEFGQLDVVNTEGNSSSLVFTSHKRQQVSGIGDLAKAYSRMGYTALRQRHSHPADLPGASVPSGHFGIRKGSRWSLAPVPKDHPDYGTGDAENARIVSKFKGFENTRFEVYNPANRATTVYNGINKAKILPN